MKICEIGILFTVINTMWRVIDKKYEKYMLHIKRVIFFGAYVGVASQRGVDY
jgi:hypothetical protein